MPFTDEEEKGIREYFAGKKDAESKTDDPEDARLDRLAGKIAAKLKPSEDDKKPDEQPAKPEEKPKNGHWSERSIF